MKPRLVFVSLLIIWRSALADVNRALSRDAAVNLIQSKIYLSASLTQQLGPDQQKQLTSQVQQSLADIAPGVLPQSLPEMTPFELKSAIPSILITNADPNFAALAARKSLLDLKINVGVLTSRKPIAESTLTAVDHSVTDFLDAVEHHATSRLAPYFTSDKLHQRIQDLKKVAAEHSRSRVNTDFKQPLDPADAQKFLAEFDRRLDAGVQRIPKRLDAVAKYNDPQVVESERKFFLMEIFQRVSSYLGEGTQDPQFIGMSPETFAPGYLQVVHQLAEAERGVSLQRDQLRQQQNLIEERKRIESEQIAPVLDKAVSELPVNPYVPGAATPHQRTPPSAAALAGPLPEAQHSQYNRTLHSAVALAAAASAIAIFFLLTALRRHRPANYYPPS